MTMVNGNVLVIGNSGVGKSTLINAVLGEDVAIATLGKHDDEQKLEIYSNENAPFNIIDSIGFEPGFLKDRHAVKAIKEWAAKGIKKDLENNQINAIWFCIDGTSSKLFDKTIKNFIKATDALKGIPVIVVITKSYSKPDRDLNIQMIEDAFSESKKMQGAISKIIPVVAKPLEIDENFFVPVSGITELIDTTNDVLPEGFKVTQEAIEKFKLNRKKYLAQSTVVLATTSAIIAEAAPIRNVSRILLGIELSEISGLIKIYGLSEVDGIEEVKERFLDISLIKIHADILKKAADKFIIKSIPMNIVNAVISGCIVAALGESAIHTLEQIYIGEKQAVDSEWIDENIKNSLDDDLIDQIYNILNIINPKDDIKKISAVVSGTFRKDLKN